MANAVKRSNDDLSPDDQNANCFGALSSFFCPPTTASKAPLSGDAFIQLEFEKLSAEEQEKIYRDLYGFDRSAGQMEEEDPSLVCQKLIELEAEIDLVRDKLAYEEAVKRCPSYVEKMKVMFLRGDLFNARKAARRLVKHWALKVELFGPDCAWAGSIKQSDLDEYDMESLAGGGVQILPEKDLGGRTIMWARREHIRHQDKESHLRAAWYVFMSQLETDEEAQKNGWVGVIYNVGHFPFKYYNREIYTKLWKVVNVLPIRIVGYHSCYNDIKVRTITPLTLIFMGKEARARFRCHFGAHAECLFELMTFGIPLCILPVSTDGQFDFDAHFSWIERMREIESNVFIE